MMRSAPSPNKMPLGDIAGTGAAMVMQVPTSGGTLQLCRGPSHGDVQHTPSTQNNPTVHSSVVMQAPPTVTGVPVDVTVGVWVGVTVAVTVGVAVGGGEPARTSAMAKSSVEVRTTRSNNVVLVAANRRAPPMPLTFCMIWPTG